MPVVEYMHHVYDGDHRRHIPGFVYDRGHWHNPANDTWVGWVRTKNDFYVPNTLKTLTREDFVLRCIAVHAVQPIVVRSTNAEGPVGPEAFTTLTTEAEIREHAETWYNQFVQRNLDEEAAL